MAHRMVRKPSETPNMNNIDDIIPFRYAYGNQDGYVIGKGEELSYNIDGNTFRVNSGRVVLQGVEDDIDANGITFTLDVSSEKRYFVVYYQVNMALNETSYLLSNYDTAGYPTIDLGDDLTQNSSGIARLPLYRFSVTNGIISDVEKVAQAIEYSGTALVGYDITKGTVEERLTKLGFKQGVAEYSGFIVEPTSNSLKKQGKYVIFNFQALSSTRVIEPNTMVEIIIPQEFRPKSSINFVGTIIVNEVIGGTITIPTEKLLYHTLNEDGIITYTPTIPVLSFSILNIGWETN